MWLSFNILSGMVDLSGLDPDDVSLRLTMSTAETEGVERMNAHLDTIITAKLLDVKPHPNADKLTLCDVDTGKEKFRVVCGAPNHKKGDIVALATVGTSFGEEFTVKKTKIRGEDSSGMLCSEKEMGLSDDHSGIMILPPDTRLGATMAELFPAWRDTRIEIDNKSITHRPDLWSHSGFAREIGALYGREYKSPVDLSLDRQFPKSASFEVRIDSPEGAPRYCGLSVKNIKIAESPEWLKAAVTAIGMRPINNIVDITNYVMVEMGQPMHAFDRSKLRGDIIIVRMAEKGEKLTTLDGEDHELMEEDVVIADRDGAVALAGVMGGGNSEIEDSTTEIVLEAANFNPVNIRKTSARYGMRTEAAIRFEKALDPALCEAAIIRSFDLIKQIIPEAEASSPIVDAYPAKAKSVRVKTSTDFIRKKIGHTIDDATILGILKRLDFDVKADNGSLDIGVPGYRATRDVSIPDDIVEEVGRVYGYDNIPPRAPMVPCAPPPANEKRALERRVKDILSHSHNLIEVRNYSFVGEDLLNRLRVNEDRELRLKNPLSQEQDRLRRSLAPNIIRNIELNQRYNESFRIYELGRVYLKEKRTDPDLAHENTRITGALYRKKADAPLFYEARAIAADLLSQLSVSGSRLLPADKGLPPYAHPGRSLEILIGKDRAGLVFELHPAAREAFEIRGQAALFDLDLDMLLAAKKAGRAFAELPRFPEVPFELSVLADRFTYASEIIETIRKSSRELVRGVEVVSVYEGEPVPAEKKSVSVRVVFAAPDHTLGPDEIESAQKKVIADLDKKGYKLR